MCAPVVIYAYRGHAGSSGDQKRLGPLKLCRRGWEPLCRCWEPSQILCQSHKQSSPLSHLSGLQLWSSLLRELLRWHFFFNL